METIASTLPRAYTRACARRALAPVDAAASPRRRPFASSASPAAAALTLAALALACCTARATLIGEWNDFNELTVNGYTLTVDSSCTVDKKNGILTIGSEGVGLDYTAFDRTTYTIIAEVSEAPANDNALLWGYIPYSGLQVGLALYATSAGLVQRWMYPSGANFGTSTVVLDSGRHTIALSHNCGVHSGAEATSYVDGAPVATTTTYLSENKVTKLGVGLKSSFSAAPTGMKVHRIALFDTNLSAAEIAAFEWTPTVEDASGFAALEYLKGNGAQYIDSGYTPTGTDTIEMKVRFDDVSTDQNLFCARGADCANSFTCWLTGGKFRFDRYTYPPGNTFATALVPQHDYIVRMDANARAAYVNGEDIGSSLTSGDYTAGSRCFFFLAHKSTDPSTFSGYGKQFFYYAAIWNAAGDLLHHFTPAKRLSDGEVGLYDTVTSVFHANQGSGWFTAGPEVETRKVLPSEYVQREYLMSTGTQYLDTGVTMADSDGYAIVYRHDGEEGNANVFGSRASSGDTRCVLGSNEGKIMYVGWNTLVVPNTDKVSDAGKNTVAVNFLNDRTLRYNGLSKNLSSTLADQTGSAYVFAGNYPYGSTVFGTYRVYELKLSSDDAVVHSYLPAVRTSDSTAGLYDTVANEFLVNQGSGTFSTGLAVDTTDDLAVRLPSGYIRHTYLQGNVAALDGDAYTGGSWIDSGYKPSGTDVIEMKVRFTDLNATQNLFCSRDSSWNNCFIGWLVGGKLRFDRNSDKVTGPSLSAHAKYVVKFDAGNRKAYLNGEDLGLSFTANTYTPGGRWTFFASQAGNTSSTLDNYGAHAIYHVRVWNAAGQLVRCYVPAERVIDEDTSEYGLYETETKTFLTNQGTVPFSVGDELAEPVGDLIAHWPFGASKLQDTSGYANTLTAGSAVTFNDDNSITCDGTANAWLKTETAIRMSDLDAFTVEVWMKLAGTPTESAALIEFSPCWYENEAGFLLDYDTGVNNFVFSLGAAAASGGNACAQATSTAVSTAPTDWHHVAAVVEKGENLVFFVDGVEGTQNFSTRNRVVPSSMTFLNYPVYLGSRNCGTGLKLNGSLSDVRIYGSKRTANEIKGEYVTGLADKQTTKYYLRSGDDSMNQSSFSGTSGAVGWSSERGGSKSVNGITVANANYVVPTDRGALRTLETGSWASPATATISVEQDATFYVALKTLNLTLNNVLLHENARMYFGLWQNNATHTLSGFWTCADGSRIQIPVGSSDVRTTILAATVVGTGLIESFPEDANAASGARTQKITGDLSGFAGDIVSCGIQYGGSKFTLELVNDTSIPKDDPLSPASVVVTNSATLAIDVDWDSGASRTWDFGDEGIPTVYVADGKTVIVRGDVEGTVGLNKTGGGKLIFMSDNGAKRTYTGTAIVSGQDLEDYRTERASDCLFIVEDIPTQYYDGTAPCEPDLVVTRVGTGEPLTNGVHYTVAFENNVGDGTATAIVTGISEAGYGGSVARKSFLVSDISRSILVPDYVELVSLTANGAQYIDAGYVPADTDAIETKVQFYTVDTDQNLWCARNSGGKNTFTSYMTGKRFRFDRAAGTTLLYSLYPSTYTDYVVRQDCGTLRAFVNGHDQGSLLAGDFTVPCHWYFFVGFEYGVSSFYSWGKQKCYYYKVWNRYGELIRHYVPVRRLSDGAVGFYEVVNGEFYGNASGNGTFTAGDDVRRFEWKDADAYTTDDYIRRGLVANWDGTTNKTDTAWTDLVGGYTFKLANTDVSDPKSLHFAGNSTSYGQLSTGAAAAFPSGVKTVDITVKADSQNAGLFLHGPASSGVAFGPYNGSILINNKSNGFGYSGWPSTTKPSSYSTIYGDNNYPRSQSTFVPYGLFLNGGRGTYSNINNYWGAPDTSAWIGKRSSNNNCVSSRLYALRTYNVQLTEPEIGYNAIVDAARFDHQVYYLCDGNGHEAYGSSSISSGDNGSNKAWGWSSTRHGTREIVTMLNGRRYVITPTSGYLRLPQDWEFCGTPAYSTLTVESGASFRFYHKQKSGGTFTLRNLTLENDSEMLIYPGDQNRTYSVMGNWTCGTNSVISIESTGDNNVANDTRRIQIGATLTGTGKIVAHPVGYAVNCSRTEKLTGDLTGWWGSLETYGSSKFTLEISTSPAVPRDNPLDPARVTVTNLATLSILCDWDSGESRTWDLGQSNCGKLNVASGKTLTIRGPLLSTNGFWQVGSGTLVLAHPRATPRTYTGKTFIPARDLEEYNREIAADTDFRIETITQDQFYEGTACTPTPTVRLRDDDTQLLTEGTDYEVSYTNNTSEGMAYVIITGKGDYTNQVLTQKFRVRDISSVKLPYGVQLLEYVEFTGGQHVDTGITPTDHQIEVRYYTTTYVRDGHIFGTDIVNGWNYMHWTEYDPSNNRSDWSYYWGYTGSEGNANSCVGLLWKQAVHDVVYNATNNHEIIIDGQLLTSGRQSSATSTLYIGRRYNNASNFKGYIYSFKITERSTGKVVRDLLPCLTKNGTAGFVDRITGGYYMPSGTLTAGPVVFNPTTDAPELPILADASFHVDASDAGTMVVEETDGVRYVKRWNDKEGNTRYAYAGWNSNIATPYLTTRDGCTFMDFGPCNHAGYGAGLAWNSGDSTIREVYMIFSDYPGCPWASFILGSHYTGQAQDYHFHRGGTRGALFNSTYASSNIKNGIVQVDGVTVSYDYPLLPGFHLIRVQTTGNVYASRFCVDRDTNGNGRGGQFIAEAIVFDKTLTDEEAASVTAHLQQKWAKLLWRPERRGKGVPGMRWRSLSNSGNLDAWTPTASDPIYPGALLACCPGREYNSGGYYQYMGEYVTHSYIGAMYMQKGQKYNFTGNYDDGSWVYLTPPGGARQWAMGNDGESSYTAPKSGWYTIDVRVANHNGGVGPTKSPFNTSAKFGAGVAWNTNGLSSCTDSNYTEWNKWINTADDVFLYTDDPSATLYGTNCFWTGSGGDECWSNVYNWAENRAPSTNGCDTVYVSGDATIDFSGAALYELIHTNGELTVKADYGDPLVLSADFTSTGTKVNWAADVFLTDGAHVFSNACPFVCCDGFRLRGVGSLTKKGPGDWTVADGAAGTYELDGTFRIEEATVHTFPDDELVWMPKIEVDGPTARLSLESERAYALNRNVLFYLGGSKNGGRFNMSVTNEQSVYRLYLLGTMCKGGVTWKPYPWGMESGYYCWSDIYGENVGLYVRGNDSNVTLFSPLGTARDTGRTRTWTGAAYDDDPDNPANWKEGVPAWYCDNVIIEADGAPDTIRCMEFHDLRLYYDWATTNLTWWGTLHLNDGYLLPAYENVLYTIGGNWTHTIDGRRFLLLQNGAVLQCTGGLNLPGTGGLRFPTDGACVPQAIVGDLRVTSGGKVEGQEDNGLTSVPFPFVTNVVVTGVGSKIDFADTVPFVDESILTVNDGARFKVGAGVNQHVHWFITNGRKRPGRVYTGSGPTGVKLPDYLSGDGTVIPRRGGMGLLILGHGR